MWTNFILSWKFHSKMCLAMYQSLLSVEYFNYLNELKHWWKKLPICPSTIRGIVQSIHHVAPSPKSIPIPVNSTSVCVPQMTSFTCVTLPNGTCCRLPLHANMLPFWRETSEITIPSVLRQPSDTDRGNSIFRDIIRYNLFEMVSDY